MMANSFKTIRDILDASRRGDSLYSIYQRLEQSEALLKERKKNAFELLFEILIPSITEEQAQELAKFSTKSLKIYATNISIPIAQAISLYKGDKLFFNEIQQLDEATAKMLAQWKGYWFFLNGLQELKECTAKALAQWQGIGLFLNGLQKLEEATAKALDQWNGSWLFLDGLKQVDESTAKAFAQWQRRTLNLNGVKQIDEATAKALAQYKGTIKTTEKILEQINKFK
ncbi:MAG: hypothetical protein AABZ60_18885 [Planctomycetota bacterium]